MSQILSCIKCDDIFKQRGSELICPKCVRAEEEWYVIVSKFLRKRENRSAHVETIVEQTGVSRDLLHKWIKSNRLHPSLYNNLSYPCYKCGSDINKGRLCDVCSTELKDGLTLYEKEKEFQSKLEKNAKEEERLTYFTKRK